MAKKAGANPRADETKLKWGEPVNGLRAALAIRTLPAGPGAADTPDLYLVVQNVSDAPIHLIDTVAAPGLRSLAIHRDDLLQSRYRIDEPTTTDVKLQPREAVSLLMTPRGDAPSKGQMLAANMLKEPHLILDGQLNIETAPDGAWTGKLITGKTGAAGEQELDELLNMIFAQQEVALYICRRLYRYFVYYEIDSAVETNVIAPMATAFRNANFDIKVPLELLLKSEHFFDAYNVGAIIKPPLDLLVGTFRESKTAFPSSSDVATQYYMWEQIAVVGGATLQQFIFVPPSVSGWSAYYQAPVFHQTWINTVTLPSRNGLTDVFIYAGITKGGFKLIMDTAEWAKQYPDAEDPDKLIDNFLGHLFTQPASISLKSVLKYSLLFGQPNFYWTQIWLDYINNPTDAAKKKFEKAVGKKLQGVLDGKQGDALKNLLKF